MLFCVLTCVLNILFTPALGHEIYFEGFPAPWQSAPHNNWHKWKNPDYYNGARSIHSFGNGHKHHPFGFFGAYGTSTGGPEWKQNDFKVSDLSSATNFAPLGPVERAGDIRFVDTENSVEQCETNDELGTCLNIKLCPGMLKLLKERPVKQSSIDLLNNIRCGFEGKTPKVCCLAQHMGGSDAAVSAATAPPDVSAHPKLALLPAVCGHIDDPRILNGQRAALFEFPWMVLIAYKSPHGIKLSCGGTLISSRYVLTAAHCVTNLTELTLTGVIIGELDIRTDPDCENMQGKTVCAPSAQNVTIEEVIPHPGYNTGFHNDIALIRLSEPADFQQDNIQPICLPLSNKFQSLDLTGLNATAIGWGATETGLQSPYLLKVALPVVSNKDCASVYSSVTVIWHKQMCAGEHERDSCGGDSGGPLVYPGLVGRQVRYVQHGLVSFGHRRCGIEGFPGVYTRVGHYVDWILDNLRP